jgi:hypothetical protein
LAGEFKRIASVDHFQFIPRFSFGAAAIGGNLIVKITDRTDLHELRRKMRGAPQRQWSRMVQKNWYWSDGARPRALAGDASVGGGLEWNNPRRWRTRIKTQNKTNHGADLSMTAITQLAAILGWYLSS